jgi:sec-independent protein translocase protein TatB
MFGVGPTELLVILVIALLVLGPKRLPELARSLGKAMGEFRRATSDIQSELENARIMLEEETRAASRASQGQKTGRGYEKVDAPPPAESSSAPKESATTVAQSPPSTPEGPEKSS